jgi:hypothetical protein
MRTSYHAGAYRRTRRPAYSGGDALVDLIGYTVPDNVSDSVPFSYRIQRVWRTVLRWVNFGRRFTKTIKTMKIFRW